MIEQLRAGSVQRRAVARRLRLSHVPLIVVAGLGKARLRSGIPRPASLAPHPAPWRRRRRPMHARLILRREEENLNPRFGIISRSRERIRRVAPAERAHRTRRPPPPARLVHLLGLEVGDDRLGLALAEIQSEI